MGIVVEPNLPQPLYGFDLGYSTPFLVLAKRRCSTSLNICEVLCVLGILWHGVREVSELWDWSTRAEVLRLTGRRSKLRKRLRHWYGEGVS